MVAAVAAFAPAARVEASPAVPRSPVQAVPVDTATLVRTTATSGWIPGSPDPSGVAWMPGADRLVVVDSEVDEVTGAGWNNVNIWVTRRDGTTTGTGTAWGNNAALFQGLRGYSREPTGVGFDPTGNVLFISDDAAAKVFVVRTGPDSVFGNLDDVVTAVDTNAIGDLDAEDPVYDPVSGHLFILDGMGTEVYRVNPVDGLFGNGNDTVTHFDIGHLGATDFEGMARDPSRGTLYVGTRTTRQVFEIGLDGTHLRTINIPSATGLRSVSGLAVAPSSTGSGQSNLFIVDRAIDNGADATENDGKLFEVSAPNVGGPVATVPGAPTIGTAVAGNGQVSLSWTAPVSNGGSPIFRYVVTPYIGAVAQAPITLHTAATTGTIAGLTSGTSYSFRVAAVNPLGTGPSSAASNVVVPAPGPPPVVVPGGAGLVEGNTGTRTLQVPVTLSVPSAVPVTAQWSTYDGSAQPAVGVDYTSASGTVTFAPGETTKAVPVAVRGDRIDEPDEWLAIVFSGATNATIGGFYGIGFGIIVDDDLPPLVTPGAVGISPEGDAGSTSWNLPVTLSSPSGFTVTVNWSTVVAAGSGLAQSGTDFVAGSGTVTFQPGETVKNVPLAILGDTVVEPPLLWGEWGLVGFSNLTNATLDTSGLFGLGLFIIVDDDP